MNTATINSSGNKKKKTNNEVLIYNFIAIALSCGTC